MKHIPYLTLLFGASAVAIHTMPGLAEVLQFDRSAFSRGEIWRPLTGHFTHFGTNHLRWDVIAFIAFGSLVEIRSRRAWLACLSVSTIAISLGVASFQPQFSIYRGLSGLDSALFAFVAADLLRAGWLARERLMLIFASVALAGFIAKSAYELTTGLTLFVEPSDAFQAVPLAHLLGAVVGIPIAYCLKDHPKPIAAEPVTASAATQ